MFLDLWLTPLYSTGGVHIQLTLQELITGISLLKECNYCPTDRRDQNKNIEFLFCFKTPNWFYVEFRKYILQGMIGGI